MQRVSLAIVSIIVIGALVAPHTPGYWPAHPTTM
jgi:hypothetical protein